MKKSLALCLIFVVGCSANVNTTDIDKKVLTKVNNEVITKNTTNIRETIKTLIQGEFKDLSPDGLTYEVGNPLLAKIDNQGNLTPLGTGIVEIKVFKQDKNWANKLLKTINVRVEAGAKPFMLPPTLLLKPEEKVGITSERMKELQSTDSNVINVENRTINAKSNGNSYVNSYDQFTNKLYSLPVLVGNDVRADFPESQVIKDNLNSGNVANPSNPVGSLFTSISDSNNNNEIKLVWEDQGNIFLSHLNNSNSSPIKLTSYLQQNNFGLYPEIASDGDKIIWIDSPRESLDYSNNVFIISTNSLNSPLNISKGISKQKFEAKISSDGSKAFWVDENYYLYSFNIINNTYKRMFQTGQYFKISENGDFISWVKNGIDTNGVYINFYSAKTDGEIAPINLFTSRSIGRLGNLSSDGSKVTFSDEEQIYVANSDGSSINKIIPDYFLKETKISTSYRSAIPQISSNGNKVVWMAVENNANINNAILATHNIYVANSNGSGTPIKLGVGNEGIPKISADGNKIVWAFRDKSNNSTHIYVANSDGKGIPIKLSKTSYINSEPQISSSGNWVVWTGQEENRNEINIYIANSDGRNNPIIISKVSKFLEVKIMRK